MTTGAQLAGPAGAHQKARRMTGVDTTGESCVPEASTPSVCIVGAGATGLITGYHLSLADAAVTFLVRPHRLEQLSRPQMLYSYDDDSLTAYSDFELLSDPVKLTGSAFDFLLITLDTAALRTDAGLTLVDEIGRAFRGTSTVVVLGSLGLDTRTWFLERSGLADSQVINGALESFAYQVSSTNMPLPPEVTQALHARANLAYRHPHRFGFSVDLSAPQAARDFVALYDRNGVTRCSLVPEDEHRLRVATFPVLVAWGLLSWPAVDTIDPRNETWRLGADAMGEFQRLSVFGPAGRNACEQTTAHSVLDRFRELETASLPLNFAAFMAYQHGAKVSEQDHVALAEALARGESEGAAMPALSALIALVPKA
jgi:hypothetical protein